VDDRKLEALALRLEAAGLADHGTELRRARDEVLAMEQLPGVFAKVRRSVAIVARRQWRNLVGELQESREAWVLVQRGLSRRDPLSPTERDALRAQIFDLIRVVPAGAIAAATAALPAPGSSLASPWVLHRLGLMPSRWREAHTLARLRRERRALAELGREGDAAEVGQLIDELEDEADQREAAERSCAVLAHWDRNQDGRWDDEERAAYSAEVARVTSAAASVGAGKRWFVQVDGHVFGPLRWPDLPHSADGPDPVLVCLDGRGGWVDLADLHA
jgi:hypothetical protein